MSIIFRQSQKNMTTPKGGGFLNYIEELAFIEKIEELTFTEKIKELAFTEN